MHPHPTPLSSAHTEQHARQYAMAVDNYDCCAFPPLDWDWDWDWGLHTLGDAAAKGDFREAFPAKCVESPVSSEASSGYLQDAVAHWSDRCKRQRMAAAAAPRRPATVNEDVQSLFQSFWDSSGGEGDLFHDLNTMIPENSSFVSEEDDALGREQVQEQGQGQGQRGPSAAARQASAAQGGDEAVPTPFASRCTGQAAAAPRPLLQLQKATAGAPHAAAQPARRGNYRPQLINEPSSRAASATSSSSCSSLAGKKRGIVVLYPFAVVKPLGLDGGGTTTLNDVNQRILKRPARPVRHPVGQFACSPAVSAHGLGLSGKAVVSLTRIRTGGKGTITIIRTRG